MMSPGRKRRPSRRSAVGLLLADALSVTGNSVVGVVIPWLVLERTGNAALAGVVAAAAVGPLVLSALLGGAIIDRVGRKRVSMAADALSALAVVAIPLADAAVGFNIGILIVLVALGAVFDGPGAGAREALTFDVAADSGISLERLTGLRETLQGIGQLAGPGLAGLLIFAVGTLPALWVTSGLFVVALTVIGLTAPRIALSFSAPAAERYWPSVRTGFVYLWRDRTLRAVALVVGVILFFVAPLESIVLPAYFAREGDVRDLGLVLSAFAVGGIVGSLGYGLLARRIRRRPLLLGSLFATALTMGLLALLPGTPGLMVIAAFIGLVAGPINPLTSVIMQERTPDHLRGRVIGSINSLALAGAPVGLLIAGPLVEALGVAPTIILIAAGCLIAAFLAAASRGLRAADGGRPQPAADP